MTDEPRHGDWMQTYTGRAFWPTDPKPEDINIYDICHALSLECRYGGHCQFHYSVAQHVVLMYDWMVDRGYSSSMLRLCLSHEFSEAYLKDMVRPLKAFLPSYLRLEAQLDQMMADKFDVHPNWEELAAFKIIDTRITLDERDALFAHKPPIPWAIEGLGKLGITIRKWQPEVAQAQLQSRIRRYWPEEFKV